MWSNISSHIPVVSSFLHRVQCLFQERANRECLAKRNITKRSIGHRQIKVEPAVCQDICEWYWDADYPGGASPRTEPLPAVSETVTKTVANSSGESNSCSPRLKLRLMESRAKDNLFRENPDGPVTPDAEEARAQHHS